MGFVKSDADPKFYYLVVENKPLILVLYVDDLFLTGSSRLIGDCKKNLATEFDMKDLGRMHYFLGLEVWQQKGGIFLGQGRSKDIRFSGFTDVDWAGSSVDWKSTSGYCFNIGSGMTSWCSWKHKSVALSSSEAEYMVASIASHEGIWLRKLLVNLFRRKMEATQIMDCVQRGVVQLSYTLTGEQVADILTKALGMTKFDYFREKMGMVKNPFQ
eukprot:PITA_26632